MHTINLKIEKKRKKTKTFMVVNFSALLLLFIFLISFSSAQGLISPTNKFTTYTGNLTNLSEMQDVNIPSPSNDEVLTWSSATLKWIAKTFTADTNSSNYWDNLDTPMDITEMNNFTAMKINATCCVYLGTIQATDGDSIDVQPTGDVDDFFSFKTPSHRPTIKREGGKFIYIESSNVYDVGISARADDTYSGTINYEKDTHKMTLLGKNSPVAIKTNSEYVNYFLFETFNHQPQMSIFNGTKLIINDSLEVVGNLNMTENITVEGKVGIGTINPQRPLHMVGDGTSETGWARFGLSTSEYTEIGHRGGNSAINAVGDGDLDFRHDGVNKMELSDTGNLKVTGNYINGINTGITGNYTNGNCWMAYSGGIMYSTNCSAY